MDIFFPLRNPLTSLTTLLPIAWDGYIELSSCYILVLILFMRLSYGDVSCEFADLFSDFYGDPEDCLSESLLSEFSFSRLGLLF